jgi:hypothetical protein
MRNDTSEAVARVVLKHVHSHVHSTIARIDALRAEIREQAITDGALRDQVRAETQAWFENHPREAQGLEELFGFDPKSS